MTFHPIAMAARRAAIIVLVTFGAGCTAASAPAPGSTPSIPSLADTKRQVAEYVDSGRYAADIAETVA